MVDQERFACAECGDTFPSWKAAGRHDHVIMRITAIADKQTDPELWSAYTGREVIEEFHIDLPDRDGFQVLSVWED